MILGDIIRRGVTYREDWDEEEDRRGIPGIGPVRVLGPAILGSIVLEEETELRLEDVCISGATGEIGTV